MTMLRWAMKLALSLVFVTAAACTSHSGVEVAPVISLVAWTHAQPCTAGTTDSITVTTTATDAETPTANLIISGTVTGCTGVIGTGMSTIMCPEAATTTGSVTVANREAHTTTATFTITACTDGQVMPPHV
jgi:hypothetical protein